MCYDLNALPPAVDQPIMAVTGAAVTITSAAPDAAQFAGYLARPAQPSGIGIVVLPDMRGLHSFYERFAEQLAGQGHTTLSIDYYGRTAGIASRDKDFPFMEHIMRVTRDGIDGDITAAANYLRTPAGGHCKTLFALGFCFGGRQAFFASAAKFGFRAVIGFYGAPGLYPNGALGPTQRAAALSAPILGLFGSADQGIPPSAITAFDEALTEAGVAHEFVTYPGAPHGFFDMHCSDHQAACADSWRRVLAFVGKQWNLIQPG